MASILHSSASVVHMLAVSLALATGTTTLLRAKGTAWHRRLGWLYVGSMGGVLLTAFRIYFLFGHFGIVHWGAVGSLLALGLGVGAAMCRPVLGAWLRWHYIGMGASITGLYAALVVESTYRLFPAAYFWWSTLGPASAVFFVGGVLLHRHYPTWVGLRAETRFSR
ncbi:MAG: hypothetical protein ACRYFZ_02445 [Janthinobacterium lividum]